MTSQPQYNVLLIEDDPDEAMLLTEALRDSSTKFIVSWVHNVAQALSSRLDDFDIVVVDHRLPDGLGVDLIEKILQRRQMPVIMVTGETDLGIGLTALDRGAMDYVNKRNDYLIRMPTILLHALNRFQLRSRMGEVHTKMAEIARKRP